MVKYIGKWVTLSNALLFLEEQELNAEAAKQQICEAILDFRIKFLITTSVNDASSPDTEINSDRLRWPIRIGREDFDWINSRPNRNLKIWLRSDRNREGLDIVKIELSRKMLSKAFKVKVSDKRVADEPAVRKLSPDHKREIFKLWRKSFNGTPTKAQDFEAMKLCGLSQYDVILLRKDKKSFPVNEKGRPKNS